MLSFFSGWFRENFPTRFRLPGGAIYNAILAPGLHHPPHCVLFGQTCPILRWYARDSLNLSGKSAAIRAVMRFQRVSVSARGEAFDDFDVVLQGSRIVVPVPGDTVIALDQWGQGAEGHSGMG